MSCPKPRSLVISLLSVGNSWVVVLWPCLNRIAVALTLGSAAAAKQTSTASTAMIANSCLEEDILVTDGDGHLRWAI